MPNLPTTVAKKGIKRFSFGVDDEDHGVLSVELGVCPFRKLRSQFHLDMRLGRENMILVRYPLHHLLYADEIAFKPWNL